MDEPNGSLGAVVYSAQPDGGILYRTTRAQAQRELDMGNAKPVKSRTGEMAIQLKALNRTEQQSPSGIPASTMAAYIRGAAWAKDKVDQWGSLQQANLERLVVTA